MHRRSGTRETYQGTMKTSPVLNLQPQALRQRGRSIDLHRARISASFVALTSRHSAARIQAALPQSTAASASRVTETGALCVPNAPPPAVSRLDKRYVRVGGIRLKASTLWRSGSASARSRTSAAEAKPLRRGVASLSAILLAVASFLDHCLGHAVMLG